MFIRVFAISVVFTVLMVVLNNQTLGHPSFLWNLSFLLLCLCSALLLFNRFWLSAFLTCAAFLAIVVADKAKFYYMDDHLRWSDMANIVKHFDSIAGLQQFIALMGNYVADAGLFRVSLLALTFVAALAIFYKIEQPFWRFGLVLSQPWARVPLGIGAAAVFLLLAPFTANALLPYAQPDRLPASSYQNIGMPMFFFASKQTKSRIPHYSQTQAAAARDFFARRSGVAVGIEPARHIPSTIKPDIIVWFNESTFDPADFRRAQLATGTWGGRVVPLFVPDHDTLQFGSLDVGVFGGKSWNTVFAFQAGAHVDWFNDDTYAASVLSQQLRTTFFRVLRRHGYRVEAMYAQDGYLFDAAKSQFSYGADRFYGSDFVNPRDATIGRATDMELVGALQKLMQNTGDEPRAYFVFTMANHGPYPAADYQPDQGTRERWGDLPIGVMDYLSRLERTTHAMRKLSAIVARSGRPTIFVHLGDHKPRIPGVEFDESVKYSTYYQIRTNFKQGQPRALGREDLDIMFLSSRILELAGLTDDLLFEANRMLAKECKPGLRSCSERGHDMFSKYRILVSENLRPAL